MKTYGKMDLEIYKNELGHMTKSHGSFKCLSVTAVTFANLHDIVSSSDGLNCTQFSNF